LTCTQSTSTLLRGNLAAVRARIADAALAAGRDPAQVRLLPVTKSVSNGMTHCLAELGELELAENRVDGLEAKAALLPNVRWHFIGHVQRNKARRVARLADVIHSVDSLRLTEALGRAAGDLDRSLDIYLQVDFTGEDAKHGMGEPELREALAAAEQDPALEVRGLMGMAPLVEGPGHDARAIFGRIADLAAELVKSHPAFPAQLSMGMSGDLEAAVAAGSHIVRVGGALYRDLDRSSDA
jgi:PLP dependent protein